jgi:hypothetical protein
MFLIDDILLLPFKGFFGLINKIAEMAEDEYYDEGKVKEGLLQAQMLLEIGQITQEQHDKYEAMFMKKLEEIRKYKAL